MNNIKDIISAIRSRVRISDIARRYFTLRQSGSNLVCLCPFHNEKTPSFNVSDQRESYHCFGCGAHGDVVNLVSKMENVSTWIATKQLAEICGVEIISKKETDISRIPDTRALEIAAKWFVYNFQRHGKAQKYITEERSISLEACKKFKIGYAPKNGLVSILSSRGVMISNMMELGLARMQNGIPMDYFSNRLIIPVFDANNKVAGFTGRTLTEQKPKYLNSKFEKNTLPPYGYHLLRHKNSNCVILTEGMLDVMALNQNGHNAVASLGTSITDQHIIALWDVSSTIILCFDGDEAGKNATLKAIDTALELIQPGLFFKIVTLDKDMDAHSMSIQDSSWNPITEAVDLSTFLMTSFSNECDLNVPEHASAFYNKVSNRISKIRDSGMRKQFFASLNSRMYRKKRNDEHNISVPQIKSSCSFSILRNENHDPDTYFNQDEYKATLYSLKSTIQRSQYKNKYAK